MLTRRDILHNDYSLYTPIYTYSYTSHFFSGHEYHCHFTSKSLSTGYNAIASVSSVQLAAM